MPRQLKNNMKTNEYIGKHAIYVNYDTKFFRDDYFGCTGKITAFHKGLFGFLPDGEKRLVVVRKDYFHCPEVDGMNPVALNPKYIKTNE